MIWDRLRAIPEKKADRVDTLAARRIEDISMEELSAQVIILLVGLGFLSAFIDASAGGGGLISIPALLFAGLPPHAAIATNKLAAFFSLLSSSFAFIRAKKINAKLLLKMTPLALVGSALGAWALQFVSPEVLRPLTLVLLVVVAVYTFFNKAQKESPGGTQLSRKKRVLYSVFVLCVAVYDGFFGPGTGSFLIVTSVFFGFNFLEASGNAKLINLATNIGALAVYFSLGAVNIIYGLIMGASMLVGAYFGASFAIKKGAAYVRILLLVVTAILIVSNAVTVLVSSNILA